MLRIYPDAPGSLLYSRLDLQGNVLWKTNLQDTYGEITFWWDFGTSPVLVGNHVVVAIMQEGHSYLLALEKTTGNLAWKIDRNYACQPESAQSYTTPLVITEGAETTIVVWGADHLTGHDAATGKLKWSYSGFNPGQNQYWRTIASPAISDAGIQVITQTQFDDNFVATPVLVQNKLLLRGTKNLYCIGQE